MIYDITNDLNELKEWGDTIVNELDIYIRGLDNVEDNLSLDYFLRLSGHANNIVPIIDEYSHANKTIHDGYNRELEQNNDEIALDLLDIYNRGKFFESDFRELFNDLTEPAYYLEDENYEQMNEKVRFLKYRLETTIQMIVDVIDIY